MDESILDYYDEFDEGGRIQGDSIERIRTQEILSRHISDPLQMALDVGGAAGVYSFWLSELGHRVHLLDASEKHINQAREKSDNSAYPLESLAVGDGRSLPFEDNTFDIVLVFGPLYHLTDQAARLNALSEAKRVMKPGALIFTAAISRYASMIDGFLYNYIRDPVYVEIMMQDLDNGQHRNIDGSKYFTTSYFHLPEELEEEMKTAGFYEIEIFSVEGVSEIMPDLHERMKDDKFRKILFDVLRATEKDRSFMGMSAHLLGKGIKR